MDETNIDKFKSNKAKLFWNFSPIMFAIVAPITGILVMAYYSADARIEFMSLLNLQLLAVLWSAVSVVCLILCFSAIFMTRNGWRVSAIIATLWVLLVTLLAFDAIFTAKTDFGFFWNY